MTAVAARLAFADHRLLALGLTLAPRECVSLSDGKSRPKERLCPAHA
jgi:hypothetical protein